MSGRVSWPTPKGGFFLWASFHDGVNTDVLLKRAIARGVLYVPGSAFFVDAHSGAEARLSFSAPSPERIDAGIARLASALREEIAADSPWRTSGVAPSALGAKVRPPGARRND